MSVNDNAYNSKSNNSKMKSPSPIYFSPYAHKKKSVENLYTEPRKIPIQTDSYSKNKTKNKISNPILTKNIINIEPQECYKKIQNIFHKQIIKYSKIKIIILIIRNPITK